MLIMQFKAHGTHPDQFHNKTMANYGLNCVLRGSGQFIDRCGRRYELSPGTVFQRLPGVVHSTHFSPTSDYTECFLSLDQRTYRDLHHLRFIEPFLVAPGIFTQVSLEEFVSLRELCRTTEKELSTPAILQGLIRFLQPIMAQAVGNSNIARKPNTLLWAELDHACRRLNGDLHKRFRLEDIAREVNMSYPTFRRIFQKQIGQSPGAYRIRSRIQKAMLLLRDMSVKSAAKELGYPDPFTFSEQFKRYAGVSPSQWQKQKESVYFEDV